MCFGRVRVTLCKKSLYSKHLVEKFPPTPFPLYGLMDVEIEDTQWLQLMDGVVVVVHEQPLVSDLQDAHNCTSPTTICQKEHGFQYKSST